MQQYQDQVFSTLLKSNPSTNQVKAEAEADVNVVAKNAQEANQNAPEANHAAEDAAKNTKFFQEN